MRLGGRAAEPAQAGVGALRYAPPGAALDMAAAPPDIRLFYQQLHAPPFPRDAAVAETADVPPWLRASADGEALSSRVAHAIPPREADPDVHEFLAKNLVVFDRDSKPDAPLLVWLSGTGGTPLDAGLFLPAAADMGFRVIGLEFDSLPAGTALCEPDPDPSCFARYRAARVWGTDDMPALRHAPQEAIVPRLTRLLLSLAEKYPDEHWDRYLGDGEPAWSRITLAGQSMGAGMAAFLAKQRRVARVILSSSPWDHESAGDALAPWLSAPSATPLDRWYGIYHQRETMAPTLRRAYAALSVDPARIKVSRITPQTRLSAPPLSMAFHGCWFGSAVPLDRDWRPTAEVKETWAFLLGSD